jgi:tetratricopeptide (TPR) repeat protein
MKRINLIWIAIALVFMACGGAGDEAKMSSDERLALIEKSEAELFAKDATFDFSKATQLIVHYDKYATANPEDEQAPSFLFKAGDLAMGMNQSAEAIRYFDRVYSDYPDFEKAPYAYFLKGFVLENQLGDIQNAEAIYKDFLAKYPDHTMAESAQFALNNLGKSPEELIREFEAKQASPTPQE